jgi:raffinose/stachyose/melibiose transport system permease protein
MGAQRYSGRSLIRELVLVAVAIVFCIPFYLLVAIALETTAQSYKTPMSFPIPPHAGNFSIAWGTKGQAGLAHPLESSLIITALSVIGVILVGSIAAYAIARHRGKLSDGLYIAFVVGIILPFHLAILPLFVAYRNLSLIGGTTSEIAYYAGFVTLNIGLLMPLTVFLYTGFIRALPRDYEEAAWVDGAGVIRTYARVVFPLLLPITATVAVIVGVAVWNEFFLPLLFLNGSRIETVPIALADYVGENGARWNLIFAGVAISVAPILFFYLFAQRHLIRGFTAGVKG